MVEARLYKPSDFGMINEWVRKRTQKDLDRRLLSSVGFLVDDTACGFIYTSSSKLAHIDFIVANPEKSKEDIKRALNLVSEKIIKFAEEKEIKMLVGYTKVESIKQLGLSYGFSEDGPYQCFYRGF